MATTPSASKKGEKISTSSSSSSSSSTSDSTSTTVFEVTRPPQTTTTSEEEEASSCHQPVCEPQSDVNISKVNVQPTQTGPAYNIYLPAGPGIPVAFTERGIQIQPPGRAGSTMQETQSQKYMPSFSLPVNVVPANSLNTMGSSGRGMSGQFVPAQLPQAQRPQGQPAQGQAVQGQVVQGQLAQFAPRQFGQVQAVQGQLQPAQLAQPQAMQAQFVQGQPFQGQMPQGQSPQGQIVQGQVQQGQMPQAQALHGQVPQGQVPQGQVPQGQMPQGQMPRGQMPQGQMPQGQMPQGQVPQGQVPPGQAMQGQMAPGPIIQGQMLQGQTLQVQMPQAQMLQAQMLQAQVPHVQPPHGQMPQVQGQFMQSQPAQRQFPQGFMPAVSSGQVFPGASGPFTPRPVAAQYASVRQMVPGYYPVRQMQQGDSSSSSSGDEETTTSASEHRMSAAEPSVAGVFQILSEGHFIPTFVNMETGDQEQEADCTKRDDRARRRERGKQEKPMHDHSSETQQLSVEHGFAVHVDVEKEPDVSPQMQQELDRLKQEMKQQAQQQMQQQMRQHVQQQAQQHIQLQMQHQLQQQIQHMEQKMEEKMQQQLEQQLEQKRQQEALKRAVLDQEAHLDVEIQQGSLMPHHREALHDHSPLPSSEVQSEFEVSTDSREVEPPSHQLPRHPPQPPQRSIPLLSRAQPQMELSVTSSDTSPRSHARGDVQHEAVVCTPHSLELQSMTRTASMRSFMQQVTDQSITTSESLMQVDVQERYTKEVGVGGPEHCELHCSMSRTVKSKALAGIQRQEKQPLFPVQEKKPLTFVEEAITTETEMSTSPPGGQDLGLQTTLTQPSSPSAEASDRQWSELMQQELAQQEDMYRQELAQQHTIQHELARQQRVQQDIIQQHKEQQRYLQQQLLQQEQLQQQLLQKERRTQQLLEQEIISQALLGRQISQQEALHQEALRQQEAHQETHRRETLRQQGVHHHREFLHRRELIQAEPSEENLLDDRQHSSEMIAAEVRVPERQASVMAFITTQTSVSERPAHDFGQTVRSDDVEWLYLPPSPPVSPCPSSHVQTHVPSQPQIQSRVQISPQLRRPPERQLQLESQLRLMSQPPPESRPHFQLQPPLQHQVPLPEIPSRPQAQAQTQTPSQPQILPQPYLPSQPQQAPHLLLEVDLGRQTPPETQFQVQAEAELPDHLEHYHQLECSHNPECTHQPEYPHLAELPPRPQIQGQTQTLPPPQSTVRTEISSRTKPETWAPLQAPFLPQPEGLYTEPAVHPQHGVRPQPGMQPESWPWHPPQSQPQISPGLDVPVQTQTVAHMQAPTVTQRPFPPQARSLPRTAPQPEAPPQPENPAQTQTLPQPWAAPEPWAPQEPNFLAHVQAVSQPRFSPLQSHAQVETQPPSDNVSETQSLAHIQILLQPQSPSRPQTPVQVQTLPQPQVLPEHHMAAQVQTLPAIQISPQPQTSVQVQTLGQPQTLPQPQSSAQVQALSQFQVLPQHQIPAQMQALSQSRIPHQPQTSAQVQTHPQLQVSPQPQVLTQVQMPHHHQIPGQMQILPNPQIPPQPQMTAQMQTLPQPEMSVQVQTPLLPQALPFLQPPTPPPSPHAPHRLPESPTQIETPARPQTPPLSPEAPPPFPPMPQSSAQTQTPPQVQFLPQRRFPLQSRFLPQAQLLPQPVPVFMLQLPQPQVQPQHKEHPQGSLVCSHGEKVDVVLHGKREMKPSKIKRVRSETSGSTSQRSLDMGALDDMLGPLQHAAMFDTATQAESPRLRQLTMSMRQPTAPACHVMIPRPVPPHTKIPPPMVPQMAYPLTVMSPQPVSHPPACHHPVHAVCTPVRHECTIKAQISCTPLKRDAGLQTQDDLMDDLRRSPGTPYSSPPFSSPAFSRPSSPEGDASHEPGEPYVIFRDLFPPKTETKDGGFQTDDCRPVPGVRSLESSPLPSAQERPPQHLPFVQPFQPRPVLQPIRLSQPQQGQQFGQCQHGQQLQDPQFGQLQQDQQFGQQLPSQQPDELPQGIQAGKPLRDQQFHQQQLGQRFGKPLQSQQFAQLVQGQQLGQFPEEGLPFDKPPQQGQQYSRPPQQGQQYGQPPQQGRQYSQPLQHGQQYGQPPQQGGQYSQPRQQGQQFGQPLQQGQYFGQPLQEQQFDYPPQKTQPFWQPPQEPWFSQPQFDQQFTPLGQQFSQPFEPQLSQYPLQQQPLPQPAASPPLQPVAVPPRFQFMEMPDTWTLQPGLEVHPCKHLSRAQGRDTETVPSMVSTFPPPTDPGQRPCLVRESYEDRRVEHLVEIYGDFHSEGQEGGDHYYVQGVTTSSDKKQKVTPPSTPISTTHSTKLQTMTTTPVEHAHTTTTTPPMLPGLAVAAAVMGRGVDEGVEATPTFLHTTSSTTEPEHSSSSTPFATPSRAPVVATPPERRRTSIETTSNVTRSSKVANIFPEVTVACFLLALLMVLVSSAALLSWTSSRHPRMTTTHGPKVPGTPGGPIGMPTFGTSGMAGTVHPSSVTPYHPFSTESTTHRYTPRGHSTTPSVPVDTEYCNTEFCRAEGLMLHSLLDRSLDPCYNFYQYVCRQWSAFRPSRLEGRDTDDLQTISIENRIRNFLDGPENASLRPLFQFWMSCKKAATILPQEVQPLLSQYGLEFLFRDAVSMDRVLGAAGKLAKQFALFSLLTVEHDKDPEGKMKSIIALDEPELIWTKASPYTDITERARAVARYVTGSQGNYEAECRSFEALARELLNVSVAHLHVADRMKLYEIQTFNELKHIKPLVRHILGKDPQPGTRILVKAPRLLNLLYRLLEYNREDLYQYMAFHYLVHLAPFLGANDFVPLLMVSLGADPWMQLTRWRVCLRLAEHVLPNLVQVAYEGVFKATQGFDEVMGDIMIEEGRNAFIDSIDSMTFFDAWTRLIAKIKARNTKVYSFYPMVLSNSRNLNLYVGKVERQVNYSSSFPKFYSDLRQFQAGMKEHDERNNLFVPRWKHSIFEPDCMYSPQKDMVYVPVGFFNLSVPTTPRERMFHVPRAVTRLVSCYFKILEENTNIYEPEGLWWTERTRMMFQEKQLCFLSEYTPQSSSMVSSLSDVEDNLAVRIALKVYDDRLYTNRYLNKDYRLATLPDVSSRQLFFIYYALSLCAATEVLHPPHVPKRVEVEGTSMKSSNEKRVNVPLMNSPEFAQAFQCGADVPMNPYKKCSLWA